MGRTAYFRPWVNCALCQRLDDDCLAKNTLLRLVQRVLLSAWAHTLSTSPFSSPLSVSPHLAMYEITLKGAGRIMWPYNTPEVLMVQTPQTRALTYP